MDPRSQVLLRQRDVFSGPVLLAGAPADTLLAELSEAQAWTWMADAEQALQQRFAARVQGGVQPNLDGVSGAVLFLPKSRELTEYLLHALASQLAGGPLFLVGEKRAGIERAAKQLAQFGRTWKLDSARHCQLWQCQLEHVPAVPRLADWQQNFPVATAHGGLQICSLPGVFSHGRLDKATALLLEHLDGFPAGAWLDFGCGSGVIGAHLKQQHQQADVIMLDADAFAVASSELTLAANQLEARVIAGAGIADAPRGLSAIITNPPFHQGVHTNYAVTEQLIKQAAVHLQPGGELRMVANSFLKYPPLIEAHLGPCKVLAERDGFRVYSACRAER